MTNGLLPFMANAALGKDHDGKTLKESDFDQRMDALDMVTQPGAKYVAFADPAFAHSRHVQKGFQGAMTQLQASFNKDCNKSRVTVEWSFGYVLTHFAWTSYPKAHKVGLSPVNNHWHAACILSNFKVCMEGNEVSGYFDVDPPDFENYSAL